MKKKLSVIFKGKCVTGKIPEDVKKYYWYLDEENRPIGISKEISNTVRDLIEINYVSIGINNLADTQKLLWLSFLTRKDTSQVPINLTKLTSIKFIFFHNVDPDLKLEFENLVQGFKDSLLVLFLESEYGVILDLSETEEDYEIEDFLYASKEDFSSVLTFYQTISYEINKCLPKKFMTELTLFKKFEDTNKTLMKYKDIFLNYMISSEVIAKHPIFNDWFKKFSGIDAELLNVVKVYLENGFNITMGAKVLHMHRNTFMNKLDRFILETGLDIRKFDEAVIAYLLIRQRRDV